MKIRTLSILASLCSAMVFAQADSPAPQQPAPPAVPSQPYTLQTGTKIVLVPATVEVKGQVLYGLHADQFVIEDNGVPQKVTLDENAEALGMSLVVLLQCSRSAVMEYAKLSQLPAMVEGLVAGAPREVALVRYGSHPELVQPFTRDMDQVNASMARMGPCEDDKAATIDAVSYAASILANRRDKFRHVVLLISETRDHGSTVKESHVIEQLGKTNTVVNAVSFSPVKSDSYESLKTVSPGGYGVLGLLFSSIQALRQNASKTLARLSGGQYINFTTQKGFEEGIGRLTNRVHNYYSLSFTVPPNAEDGLHEIKVKVPEYPNAVIRSREAYWAGTKPAPDVK